MVGGHKDRGGLQNAPYFSVDYTQLEKNIDRNHYDGGVGETGLAFFKEDVNSIHISRQIKDAEKSAKIRPKRHTPRRSEGRKEDLLALEEMGGGLEKNILYCGKDCLKLTKQSLSSSPLPLLTALGGRRGIRCRADRSRGRSVSTLRRRHRGLYW